MKAFPKERIYHRLRRFFVNRSLWASLPRLAAPEPLWTEHLSKSRSSLNGYYPESPNSDPRIFRGQVTDGVRDSPNVR